MSELSINAIAVATFICDGAVCHCSCAPPHIPPSGGYMPVPQCGLKFMPIQPAALRIQLRMHDGTSASILDCSGGSLAFEQGLLES